MKKKTLIILGDNNFWYETIVGTEDEARRRIDALNYGEDIPENSKELPLPNCYFIYEVTESPIVIDGIIEDELSH